MARVAFVACSKTKSSFRKPAAALYKSALFRKSFLAAFDVSKKVFILSAKHGLLRCSDEIDPYDVTLKTMRKVERDGWGFKTGTQLSAALQPHDKAILFCGDEYVTPLRDDLKRLSAEIDTPLGAASLGKRLSLLKAMNGEQELWITADRFLRLMQQVWIAQSGGRRVADTHGRQPWPSQGVYFILAGHGISYGRLPRIVRVGTHAVSQGSKTTLWDRLSTHRGTSMGGGSHRSSIFRLHLGRALARQTVDQAWPESWGSGQSAPADIRRGEEQLERNVSELIGAMQTIWLDVPDEPGPQSERAYIERNAIGLLSRVGLLRATAEPEWLGHFSADWRIATSGLWNVNHVFYRPDPDFIPRLSASVERTIGRSMSVLESDAALKASTNQLSFFPKRSGS